MSEDIKQDRSPRSPKIPLEDAISLAKRLYDKAGRSAVKRDVAVKAMGYNGISGASATSLATLGQYGLVEKDGSDVKISALALKIFHPTNPDEAAAAIREAALVPNTFKSIFESHHELAEEVLANHLIHQGFTQDASKKAASVYKENSKFAKLDENGTLENKQPESQDPFEVLKTTFTPKPTPATPMNPVLEALSNLSELTVPIGDNRAAKVPFPMTQEDFDLFLDTLKLWKKKIVKEPTRADPSNVDE